MNRQFLLLAAFLFAGLSAFAQTFQFQYKGADLEDGATVTIAAEENIFGELSCETNPSEDPNNGLVLKMQDLSAGNVKAELQIQNNGLGASMLQWCMGGACTMALNKTSLTKSFAPAGTVQVLFDATNIKGNGNLMATLTVTQNGQTRTVGILFTNEDATSIKRPTPTLSKGEGVVYDLSGRIVDSKIKNQKSKLGKGLYIINGKKVIR
ncbi:MAG: hypothetical protein J5524_04480 [Bacteroidaceae bacterium]|nr:hypothetical protein [Bacteroidaceae bacterium]